MRKLFLYVLLLSLISGCQKGEEFSFEWTPGAFNVNPNASPEARQLLQLLYDVSGKYTLTGQHNHPVFISGRTEEVKLLTGHYPAVWGQEFGQSLPNSLDGINFRQRNMEEAILKYHEGYVITLMWHAIRPIDDEPGTFDGNVMASMTNTQWEKLLTPGTRLHKRWCNQVDVIAGYLAELRDAGVPVLWRPYHEPNGDWFWWCGNPDHYKKLYRMLFDRFVNVHHLNNLIWVFNGTEIRNNVKPYADFYPGDDVVDILATDVYSENFQRSDYRDLLALADGKPIGLGEVGKLPSRDTLANQPKYCWFMCWSGYLAEKNTTADIDSVYNAPNTLTLNEWKEFVREQTSSTAN